MPPTSSTSAADPMAGEADLADPVAPTWSIPTWWPWAVGLLLSLVVVGPGLSGGSLLSLDLQVTPHIPIPNGMFGLGPALSQRVPLFAVIGAGSALVGGPVAVKVLVVAFLTCGFAGGAHLVRVLSPRSVHVGVAGQFAAGLLWAGGPYALTRLAVGHINLLWVVAILPWVLPRLCRPAEHLPSTFLASLALAIGGPGGGTLGVAAAFIALLVQPKPRRVLRPLLAIVVPQLIWIVPTAVLLWAGAGVTGSNGFATHIAGAGGWPAVAAGNGFWRADYQVGAIGPVGAVAGVLLVALAFVGGRGIVRSLGFGSWQGAATVVGVAGLLLAAASAVPGVRSVYGWLSDLPVGAPLRESQRFLALWLVWAAPAVVIGAVVLADRARVGARPAVRRLAPVLAVFPLVLALALSIPGWWGLDGRLKPVDYPSDWATVRAEIAAHPGTVVALPWSEYPSLSFLGGRQAFNPIPEYLGGDVISSYDPRFDQKAVNQEQVDRRSEVVDGIVARAKAGRVVSGDLADLGVRWVMVANEIGSEPFEALAADAGLTHVLALPQADLYEVVGWRGAAVAPDGSIHAVRRPVPPVLRTDAPKGSILNVAGAPGWVQGWGHPVAVTADGRLRLESTGGLLWFWPSLVILAVDVGVAGLGLWCLASRKRSFGRILAPGAPGR